LGEVSAVIVAEVRRRTLESLSDVAQEFKAIHDQFEVVRDVPRTKLQFRDVLYRDEIARIAASVTDPPSATSVPVGAPRPKSQPSPASGDSVCRQRCERGREGRPRRLAALIERPRRSATPPCPRSSGMIYQVRRLPVMSLP
jgi:hypothetical protein